MKKLLLTFLKKTIINELRDMFKRNTTQDERTTVINWLIKVRDRTKDGIGKNIIEIVLESLN